jgi:hypothetical protein
MEAVSFSRSSSAHNPCDEIYNLASTVYPAHVVIKPEILKLWYASNNEVFFLAYFHEKLIGYISLLPITESKFQELYTPDFDENTITRMDILPFSESTYFLNSSIVVHPDFRENCDVSSVSRILRINMLSALLVLARKVKVRNIEPIQMAAEAITVKGGYMCQSLGLKFVAETKPGSKLYVGTLSCAHLQNLINALLAKLPEYYRTKERQQPLSPTRVR